MTDALVIAYGNPLRGDDGAAWIVADQLSSMVRDSVHVLRVHQLSPELADLAHDKKLVIFVDASADEQADGVRCTPVAAKPRTASFWHHIDPEEILALSLALYAKSPQGFLITLCGEQFNHGFALSPSIENAIPKAVTEIRTLLTSNGFLLRSEVSASRI